MTGDHYAEDIKALGLNQVRAAQLFGADPRTGRRWVRSGPPRAVEILLTLLKAGAISVDQLQAIADQERARAEQVAIREFSNPGRL